MSKIVNIITILLVISIGSFTLPLIFGRFIGVKGIQVFVATLTFFTVCLSSLLFYLHVNSDVVFSLKLFKWIQLELVSINFGILIDPLSVIMLFVVSIISFCANIYSMEYMSTDPHLLRYFSYLSLFTFFMILLVTSENLLQLFIGWEGVGICSYILINFWYCRIQANKSSILAVIANKLGDVALLLGSTIIYFIMKTNSFLILSNIFLSFKQNNIYIVNDSILNYFDSYYNSFISVLDYKLTDYTTIAVLLFIVACIGKSAQFGFHFWLPEAMEGPTPVSSLIHAATMVTAGIFLILRISNILVTSSIANTYILIIGSVTLFFAATIGLTQVDIKKIVAYSTCSQLGYMFLSCGFYGFSYSFFHLFIHAFFKALLFLTAGYIIHLLCNEQDIRKMGGMLKIAPFGYNLLVIGSFALIGFPYMSGWYSKESLVEYILNKAFTSQNIYIIMFNNFSIVLAFITIVITLLYSIKSILEIYFFSFNGFKYYIKNLHYNGLLINIPLFILAILSIYSGYIFNDLFIGLNAGYLGNSINVSTGKYLIIAEYHPYYRFFVISLMGYFSILYIVARFYVKDLLLVLLKNNSYIYNLYYAIAKKYIYINRIFMYKSINNTFKSSYIFMYKLIDKGFLEIIGPYGIVYNLYNIAIKIGKLQSGYIYHYIGYIFIVLILFIFIIIYNI